MKLSSSKIILGAALLGTIAVLFTVTPYFFLFHGPFSDNQNNWADFGSYVGGVLGGSFAYLAFLAVLFTIHRQIDEQKRSDLQQEANSILESIKLLEQDVERICSKHVTCNQPMVWGHGFSGFDDIKEVPLRTLLTSDALDWNQHLTDIRDNLAFRIDENGDIIQDRDVWLQAKIALEAMFKKIDEYRVKLGNDALVEYYFHKWEFAKNRITESDWEYLSEDP